jgi:16S rRNA (guanine527-N7)-methyltransferase
MDARCGRMNTVTPALIEEAFQRANLGPLPDAAFEQMAAHLEILERWNTKFNLTALRSPNEIIQRHLVECAFAAQKLPSGIATLMDYGSGAGFPGLVIAICRPEISVTLAEVHLKKASFLREVVRSLGVRTEVASSRVEDLPHDRRFEAVSMRAVEKMEQSIPVAIERLERYLALLTTKSLAEAYKERFQELDFQGDIPLPGSGQTVLALAVPRGTRL